MWTDVMTTILRAMVDDLSSTTYQDSTLQQVLAVAAFKVRLEMAFSTDFRVDVAAVTITPDPTDATDPAHDATWDSFVNLVSLKAACLLDHGGAMTAARQAISVVDNKSAVDLRGIAQARLKLLQAGYCKAYEDAKLEYMAGQSRVAGAAVMTPFRVYSYGGGFFTQVTGRDRDVLF